MAPKTAPVTSINNKEDSTTNTSKKLGSEGCPQKMKIPKKMNSGIPPTHHNKNEKITTYNKTKQVMKTTLRNEDSSKKKPAKPTILKPPSIEQKPKKRKKTTKLPEKIQSNKITSMF